MEEKFDQFVDVCFDHICAFFNRLSQFSYLSNTEWIRSQLSTVYTDIIQFFPAMDDLYHALLLYFIEKTQLPVGAKLDDHKIIQMSTPSLEIFVITFGNALIRDISLQRLSFVNVDKKLIYDCLTELFQFFTSHKYVTIGNTQELCSQHETPLTPSIPLTTQPDQRQEHFSGTSIIPSSYLEMQRLFFTRRVKDLKFINQRKQQEHDQCFFLLPLTEDNKRKHDQCWVKMDVYE